MNALLCIANEHFRLRPGRPSDFDAIMRHGDQPDESFWLGVPYPCPPERAEKVLAEFARGWAGTFGLARLVVDHADEIIGLVSLARHSPSCIEVSYGIAPARRGRGLATSVVQLVTDRVLHVDQLADRMEAVIDPKNVVSIRVATKAGYAYEGRRRGVTPGTGQAYDDLLYVRTSGWKQHEAGAGR